MKLQSNYHVIFNEICVILPISASNICNLSNILYNNRGDANGKLSKRIKSSY